MKYFLLVLFSSVTIAQVPNESFEDWSDELTPEGWQTNNKYGEWITVSRSETASEGSFSARLEVVSPDNWELHEYPFMSTVFTASQAYTKLSGFYQFHPTANNAYLEIKSVIFINGNSKGGGVTRIKTAAKSYTPFNMDIDLFGEGVPDSIKIQIRIAVSEPAWAVESYALIDQLSFSQTTGIADENESPAEFRLSQNYPNPFNPETRISWETPAGSRQILKIFDMLGNEVATLIDEYRDSGKYEAIFNAGELTSGVYLFQLKAGAFVQTRKMVLMK